jgi:hypothetical protein
MLRESMRGIFRTFGVPPLLAALASETDGRLRALEAAS